MDYFPHFKNGLKCNLHNHGATCSVDCLIEIFQYGIFPYTNLDASPYGDNPIVAHMLHIVKTRKKSGPPSCLIREPLWDWLVQNIANAFAPKGRGDAEVLEALESLHVDPSICDAVFQTSYCKEIQCNKCGVIKNMKTTIGPVYDYLQTVHEIHALPNNFGEVMEQCIKQSIMQQLGTPDCDSCKIPLAISQYLPLKYNLSDILLVNIGLVDGQNVQKPPISVPEEMQVQGVGYILTSAVQMEPGHFVAICKHEDSYLVIDDMRDNISVYQTFAAALNRNPSMLGNSEALRPWLGTGPKRCSYFSLCKSSDQCSKYVLCTRIHTSCLSIMCHCR